MKEHTAHFLRTQWSRKIAIALYFHAAGTLLAVFVFKATFAEWASFTEWIGGLIFAANVADKFTPAGKAAATTNPQPGGPDAGNTILRP